MTLSLLEKPKVLVCVGSGGVGKTTVAACLGVMAAQQGKRVLVLTIDPAKRLAQTLGIEGSKDITKVPGQNFKGELSASVIDHKKLLMILSSELQIKAKHCKRFIRINFTSSFRLV